MNILVVAATREEIEPLISEFGGSTWDLTTVGHITERNGSEAGNQNKSKIEHSKFEILITGVGMVATAFALGRHLAIHQYDLAINLGIAGSFDRSITLGEVLEITQDTFTELGAENDTEFITLDTLGFGQTTFKTQARLAYYTTQLIRQVTGATVNTVHGADESINKLYKRIAPQLESMEGAAFFYACEQAGVPALQIRAVSNYVEKRNRDAWKIGLAVKNLNTFAVELLSGIS